MADAMLEALIEVGSPGIQYLDLVTKNEGLLHDAAVSMKKHKIQKDKEFFFNA